MKSKDADRKTMGFYNEKYGTKEYYWTLEPSSTCFRVLQKCPPLRSMNLLDIGCGEGRNAVFFARNGYLVDAMDISGKGVEKTKLLAKRANVGLTAFQADVNAYRLEKEYDVLFSTAVFQCVPEDKRRELFEHYKEKTKPGGIHMFSVFVKKPFIAPAPDRDPNANPWRSGELLGYYSDWRIEWCTEEIFDCNSSGVPHQHAADRVLAVKP